jgi:tRNA (guanine37-N1)-methyltransferase
VRIDVVTIFPRMLSEPLADGIVGRARAAGLVEIHVHDLREHTDDRHRSVDDAPFGGGPGMVMKAEPFARALAAIRAEAGSPPNTSQHVRGGPAKEAVVLLSPRGRRFDQQTARRFAGLERLVLLCGRYEGIDQRVIDTHVTDELSLGDFVLSGGELPALALLDAVARLQDGVLHAPSHQQDSFSDGLLEGAHYSRPETLDIHGVEHAVPAVLLSGHHGEIARWRREQALALTARRRPDLIAAARAAGRLSPADEKHLARLGL